MAETGDPNVPGSRSHGHGNGKAHDVDARAEPVIDLRDRSSTPLATYVEAVSGLRMEVHRPLDSPRRWRQYLDGAAVQYRAWGVENVLPVEVLAHAPGISLVFVAVDHDDRVVGGIRCHGPLRDVSEAHALVEVAGTSVWAQAHDFVALMISFGAVEMKGAWIDPERAPRGVSTALARCCVHAMTWFGTRFSFGTGSTHTARLWGEAGARSFADLDGTPYPDERYSTVMVHWDRGDVELHATAAQWTELQRETAAFRGRPGVAIVDDAPLAQLAPTWRAEVLDTRLVGDSVRLLELQSDPGTHVIDRTAEQRAALARIQPPVADEVLGEEPRWAHYPWRQTLVRLLGPQAFRALRLDRNRNKITTEEQERLAQLNVGVVGLSVGHAIAHALALEGTCAQLRLADFDELELSNLNRIPATVLDLGLNKAQVVARRIAELDPYLDLVVETDGLVDDNLDSFVAGLDVLIEECDSLDVKALVREAARRRGVPVLMETSDRGLLDVERFDHDPDRPIFHGLLGDLDAADLRGLSTRDKVPHVLRILEPDQLSSRMAASLAEIDQTLTTWPQLGGDVLLGAATIAAAVRAIGRGDPLPSGRVRIDLPELLEGLTEPAAPVVIDLTDDEPAGPLLSHLEPRAAVAHAANLAPSGGNVQPWGLVLEPDHLDIRIDRARTSAMDVDFRGSHVAIGAALLNARVAAAAHGLLGEVEILPDGTDPDLVARLTFGTGADPALASMHDAVAHRATNRRPGDGAGLPPGLAEELGRVVDVEGGHLHLLTDREAIAAYAELLGRSDQLRFLTPRLHREMMGELRWPGRDPIETGIDVRTLELDQIDLSKLAVAGRADVMADLAAWGAGRALGDTSRERVPTSSAIAVVTVDDTTTTSYVRGGSAVQRLWLAAAQAGLSVQPISPISVFAVDETDIAGLVPEGSVDLLLRIDREMRELAGIDTNAPIALVVRLSRSAPPSVRSRRLPLDLSEPV